MRGKPLEIWGDGETVRDFVYIEDVCDAIARAASYVGEQHVFNVGSGIGRTINSVVDDIETILTPLTDLQHLKGVLGGIRAVTY